jgi:hypothetical protein
MRSWIGAIRSFAETVMTAKVRSHVLVKGSRQFSYMPATPNTSPSLREIA